MADKDKTPLFTSALELYAHAVELCATKRPRDLKFAILHLANAVELLLKDALLGLGESIYENPKQTISIWEAFKRFDKLSVTVPEKPHLELLIDDRNTIQHRFGSPDELTTFYYLDAVTKFLKQFLNERYALKFEDVVPEYLAAEYLPLIGLAPAGAEATEAKIKARLDVAPPAAVLDAFNDLYTKLTKLILAVGMPAVTDDEKVIEALMEAEYLPADALEKFQLLRQVRNAAAHGRSDQDWNQAIQLYHDLVEGVDRAIQKGYSYQVPQAETVGANFAAMYFERVTPEDVRTLFSQRPRIPADIDAELLKYGVKSIGWVALKEDEVRKRLRTGFWGTIGDYLKRQIR